VETYKLVRPITFEEEEITKLDLDFGKLNGAALQKIEQDMQRQGVVIINGQMSGSYCAACAAVAAGIPMEMMLQLSGPDYMGAVTLVQGFLMGVSLSGEAGQEAPQMQSEEPASN